MSLEQTACEDLKAFERRLTEVIACLHPSTTRWRSRFLILPVLFIAIFVLIAVSICVATGASQWIMDPDTRTVSLTQSLSNHPFFILSTLILIGILLLGVHRRVVAASIITSRTREVLSDFNMSCDDTGHSKVFWSCSISEILFKVKSLLLLVGASDPWIAPATKTINESVVRLWLKP